MSHPRTPWTAEAEAMLTQHYPTTAGPALADMLGRPLRTVYYKAWSMGLKKSREFISEQARAHMLDPAHPARKSQFQPGLTPWNKGKPFDSGGRSVQTRFKPGNKPSTTLPMGAYRLVHEVSTGRWVLEQKTSDTSGASNKRWTAVSRLVWQRAHGPIAPGHVVVFKPGMFTNKLDDITADKLDCITRAEHAYRNSARCKSPELAGLVALKGHITRQVNRINREHNERHTGAAA